MAMAEQQDGFSLAAVRTLQQSADDDRDPREELVIHGERGQSYPRGGSLA